MVIDLNTEEMDERFGALIIAAQNGHIEIARQLFDMSLDIAAMNSLDQAIELLNQTGNTRSCEIINLLKAREDNLIR